MSSAISCAPPGRCPRFVSKNTVKLQIQERRTWPVRERRLEFVRPFSIKGGTHSVQHLSQFVALTFRSVPKELITFVQFFQGVCRPNSEPSPAPIRRPSTTFCSGRHLPGEDPRRTELEGGSHAILLETSDRGLLDRSLSRDRAKRRVETTGRHAPWLSVAPSLSNRSPIQCFGG